MADKPGIRPADKATAPAPKSSEVGHLSTDDRGNVTWEWSEVDENLLADDEIGATARMRALVDPSLEVEEDDDDTTNPLKSNPKGLKSGYNPYNSGALGKATWKKSKDLRELSKWIELRKKMGDKKDDEG